MKIKTRPLLVTALLFIAGGAQAKEITVMISGGFKAALTQLAPRYEAQHGDKVVIVSGPSMGKTPQAIPNRLARGEKADVVIMVGDALKALESDGKVVPDSRVELADSPIGAVVKEGQPKVDISTEAALRTALLNAKSIAYSDSASGKYISTQLFKKLGIEKEVGNKAHQVERIPVASQVAKGTYQLGFQQVSELMPEHGVTFIGELPDSVQYITRFAGAIPKGAENEPEAKALLNYLASAEAQKVVHETGLKSVTTAPMAEKHAVQ
ncbi:substrate-binding domain-containing protein [Erwinia sp. 9145]|uniref:substrate-binding domain-containing protein n=1 Tax=Erwinia sp. 9145 TaxID=1500895 RepID=UPI0005581024|nr:substrate-binding domain-containing protein [Erwinia sp. 9145]